MTRSISIVEFKVMQTHFFLTQINNAGLDFFAAQCFTDAFGSAARSITFAMQAVLKDIPKFETWYSAKQEQLKHDPLCRFFNAYRDASIHIGDTVVRGGAFRRDDDGNSVVTYYFAPIQDLDEVPDADVFLVCSTYFTMLLSVVFDAFRDFRYELDDRWYYTQEHFERLGKTIEDAEEELGFPRGWTAIDSIGSGCERWRVIRLTQTVGCQINHLFQQYLRQLIEGPDESTGQSDP